MFPPDLTEPEGFVKPIFDYTCNQKKKWTDPYTNTAYDLPDQVASITKEDAGSMNQNIDYHAVYLLGCDPTTSRGAPCAPQSMCREPPRGGGRSCARALCIANSAQEEEEEEEACNEEVVSEELKACSRQRYRGIWRGKQVAAAVN
jgi:hypothetical protein